MSVKIHWQPPLVLEERKQSQWENIIRSELGELGDPFDVSMCFDAENLRWKVEAGPERPAPAASAARTRARVVDALRAHCKPVV